eukprot:7062169-Prymnesium_polylepis.1
MQTLQYEALAELLDLDYDFVAARYASIARAFGEWESPELLFRYLDDNRDDPRMAALIKRWLRSIFGLSDETLRHLRRESPQNVRHLQAIPKAALLRWYAEACPGTSSMKVLFLLGEDAGSCLRLIGNEGNLYNRALMGYVLQSHVRALVVCDAAGRVQARSLVRLLVRSDTITPVIYCDPVFFGKQYSRELQASLAAKARELERHMRVPVVHAGSVLPVLDEPLAKGGHVRRVAKVGYDVVWVDLMEMDGVAPYTYSEELPYDDMLDQHRSGVQERTDDSPALVVAALPRADSPSANQYVAERRGQTAWTRDGGEDVAALPEEGTVRLVQSSEHVSHLFNLATARRRDLCATELERRAADRSVQGFQASLLAWLLGGYGGG